jgi:malonyl-CoA/methylmalonyl-CoA synthetase
MADRLGTPAVLAASRAAWERHLGGRPPEDVRTLADAGLIESMDAVAERWPDRPALSIAGRDATHGEIAVLTSRVARWLHAQGVGIDAVVLVCGHNSLPMVVAYLGAVRAGASVVLANPQLTKPELAHLLADSGAVVAFADHGTRGALQELRGSTDLRAVVDLDAAAGNGQAYEDLIAGAGDEILTAPRPTDAPVILAYTSGTTGTPKAVPLTNRNLLSSVRAVMLAWDWSDADVLVHALPVYHQHGLGGVHIALLSGSRTVVLERFDPRDLCDTVAREGATVLFAVPTIYERLLEWEGIRTADLRSLRLVVSGSAALSPQLAERAAGVFGELPLERYGTTESGLNVSNPLAGPRRVGAVGLPLPGIELAIAGEDGAPVEPGTAGEVVLRGPQIFGGYRGSAAPDAFYPGGWFRTGDVGVVDADDGYLSIVGRSKELIITGGMNVYPREVELALELEPSIAAAAAVGVPSRRWGEEVVALVVAADGVAIDPPGVLAAARTRLAPYKCPKRLIVVDQLPRNVLGKVVRREAAAIAAEAAG